METESVSLIDLVGIMPPILFLISILMGIMALLLRRNRLNQFTLISLLGMGFLGVGMTGLRFFNSYAHLSPIGAYDPTQMLYIEGCAWGACGIICFGAGIGFVLTALAVVLTSRSD